MCWKLQDVFQEGFKGVERVLSKVFQAGFKDVSGKFHVRFKSPSKGLPGIFKGVSRKVFLWCLREASGVFLECFQEVSRVFQEYYREVLFRNSIVSWQSSQLLLLPNKNS